MLASQSAVLRGQAAGPSPYCSSVLPKPSYLGRTRRAVGSVALNAGSVDGAVLTAQRFSVDGVYDLLVVPERRTAQPVKIREHVAVDELCPATFDEYLATNSDSLVLVDYYTDWCGPCKVMHRELDKLTYAFTRRVKFAKFNVGKEDSQVHEFATRHRIRSLPTFRLYKNGRVIDELTGAKPIQLRQMLTHFYRG